MEGQTFILPAVAEKLENHFVEARLHTDLHEEFRDLEMAIAKSIGQPLYLVVPADSDLDFTAEGFDPSKVKILSRLDGALGSKFEGFLEDAMQAK